MPVQLNGRGPEWYQITYTSSDTAQGGRGGWGVKDVTPGTPPEVTELLSRFATTRLVEVLETSQFASAEDLARRARRLLSRDVDGRLCLWHSASAGQDATGRPGNVFTHAAVLQDPDQVVRPIEFWRSGSWLVPFGVNEVGAARLGELAPGDVVGPNTVIDFVRRGDRLFSLEWLMAALAHAVEVRAQLVLGVGSPDEAAMWLGAIAYMTSAPQGRRISWVTYERAENLEAMGGQSLTIVCIPREDLAQARELAGPRRLVLDLGGTLSYPEGDLWHDGLQSFPVARFWQNSVLDAFALDDADLLRVLDRMDSIARDVAADALRRLPLHWPLSAALLTDGAGVVSSREELVFEVLNVSDSATLRTPALVQLVDAELASLPADELQKLADDPLFGPILAERQATRQLRDYVGEGWRAGAPVPAAPAEAARLVQDMVPAALARAQELAESGDTDQLVTAARFVTFAVLHLDAPESHLALQRAVGAVRAGLGAAEVPADTVVTLHGELWPEGFLPPRMPSSGMDEAPLEGELTQAPTAPAGDLSPDPEAARALIWELPAGVPEALETLREHTHETNSQRLAALDDALLVAWGLRAVPIVVNVAEMDAELTRALDALRADAPGPAARRALLGWVIAYHAVADAEMHPAAVPADVLAMIKADPDHATASLARFITEATEETAAKIFVRMVFREVHGAPSILTASLEGGSARLGRRAFEAAWAAMDPQRRDTLWGLIDSELEGPRRALPGERVNQLVQSFLDHVTRPTARTPRAVGKD